MSKPSVQTSLRIPPDLYTRLEKIAAAEGRTLAGLIRWACLQYAERTPVGK